MERYDTTYLVILLLGKACLVSQVLGTLEDRTLYIDIAHTSTVPVMYHGFSRLKSQRVRRIHTVRLSNLKRPSQLRGPISKSTAFASLRQWRCGVPVILYVHMRTRDYIVSSLASHLA